MQPDKQTILIVEDEEAIRDVYRKSLADKYIVREVSTLDGARLVLAWCTPDVILLDLGLTDSHHSQTLGEMKALAGDVPIVVCTGYDLEKEAIAQGAEDFIGKTEAGHSKCLLGAIRRAILRKEARDQLAPLRGMLKDSWEILKGVDTATLSG